MTFLVSGRHPEAQLDIVHCEVHAVHLEGRGVLVSETQHFAVLLLVLQGDAVHDSCDEDEVFHANRLLELQRGVKGGHVPQLTAPRFHRTYTS